MKITPRKIKYFEKFKNIKYDSDNNGFFVGYKGYPHSFIEEFNFDYLEKWLKDNNFIYEWNRDGNFLVNKYYTLWVSDENSIGLLYQLNKMMEKLEKDIIFDDIEYYNWLHKKYCDWWLDSGKEELIETVVNFVYQITNVFHLLDAIDENYIVELWQNFGIDNDSYYLDEIDTGLFYLNTKSFLDQWGDYILTYFGGDKAKIERFYAYKNPQQLSLNIL